MLEDVFEGVFRALGRLFAQIFVEVIFELLIKGPGYFICKLFSRDKPDPDSGIVILIGLLFWIVLGWIIYSIFSTTALDNSA